MRATNRPPAAASVSPLRAVALAAALTAACGAQAQADAAGGSGLRYFVDPGITTSLTLTDNPRLVAVGRRPDAILRVSPSVRVGVRGQRVQGSIDYALDGIVYARASERNTLQHRLALSSVGGLELVEHRVFLDADARIAQQATTAFGQAPVTPGLPTVDTTQVATYSLSPHLRGRLGGFAEYTARVRHTATVVPDRPQFDSSAQSVLLGVGSGADFARLGWSVNAQRTVSDFAAGRRTTADTVVAGLSYRLSPELVVHANAGSDWHDFRTVQRERFDRYGAGFDWRPTPRTQVSARVDERHFGTGYDVSFSHRMPRTSWTLRAARATTEVAGRGVAAVATLYDLLFARLAAVEPDPLRREQLVLAILRDQNLPPDLLVFTDVLFGAVTLQESQSLTFAAFGRRTTVTTTLLRLRSSRLDTLVTGIGDTLDATASVRQLGANLAVAHRLTPDSTASVSLSELRNEGDLAAQRTRQRALALTWGIRLGPRSSFALTARHVDFDSPTAPYTENAVVATFGHRF
jgi:uncharacterized protein (PEP-CTERM system associated)